MRTLTPSVYDVGYPGLGLIRIVRVVLRVGVAVVRVVRFRLKCARVPEYRRGIHCVDRSKLAKRGFFAAGVV